MHRVSDKTVYYFYGHIVLKVTAQDGRTAPGTRGILCWKTGQKSDNPDSGRSFPREPVSIPVQGRNLPVHNAA